MILPPLIAHRGASQIAPENTISAFIQAKQLGATWLEFDVQLSADDQAVIVHDDTLERTTNGHGNVRNTLWQQLQTLDAGSWFGPQYYGETIPNLHDTLTWLTDNNMAANIEIKASPWEQHNLHLAEIVASIIAPNLAQHHIILSSFSWPALQRLRQLLPEAPLGLLVDINQPQKLSVQVQIIQETYQQLNCVSLHLNNTACTFDTIATCQTFAQQIAVFTVNQYHRVQDLMQWGVHSVFSDNPQLLDYPKNSIA